MPVAVGTILSTVSKYGLKFTPEAPAEVVATMQMASQVVQACTSLQFVGIFPIPVIPFGSIIDYIFTMIEALFNRFRQIIARIRKQMLEQYTLAKNKAVSQRTTAETTLYTNLKTAQQRLIVEVAQLKVDLKKMQIRLPQIQKEYEQQYALYQKTVQDYAIKVKAANTAGDKTTEDYWTEQISALDPWLETIVAKLAEKVELIVDIKFTQLDIEEKTPPTLIQLQKDWTKMAYTWSYTFDVAVPYYPDLPDYPNLPVMPPKWTIPQIIKCMAKGMAKWLATPTLPPLGVFIDALMHCIMNQIPVNTPPLAAQVESTGDSLIEYMGLAI